VLCTNHKYKSSSFIFIMSISYDYIDETLKTLGELELGQKLSVRAGNLVIDKNPSGIKRWLWGDSSKNILPYIDEIIKLALEMNVPIDEKVLTALDNLKQTYSTKQDMFLYITKIQNKITLLK
jgi:hypothetical protein